MHLYIKNWNLLNDDTFLILTGAICSTSKGKYYQGFETLLQMHWCRKCSISVRSLEMTVYITCPTWYRKNISIFLLEIRTNIPLFKPRGNFGRNSFFPASVVEWSELDPAIQNKETYQTFKNHVLIFIKVGANQSNNLSNVLIIACWMKRWIGLNTFQNQRKNKK